MGHESTLDDDDNSSPKKATLNSDLKSTSKQQCHHHHPQYLVCGILSLGGFIGGVVTGWSSTSLPSIESSGDFTLGPNDLSWIASIVNLGGVVSAPITGYMMRKCGRKSTLIFSIFPLTTGWASLAFPLHIWMLYLGRFLTGFGLNLMALTSTVYLSEIAEPSLRGQLSVMRFVAVRTGILFAYGVGSLLPYNQLSAICAVFSVAFGICIFVLPESPRWLMSRWQIQNAVDSLCWLRTCAKSSPSQEILEEIEEIKGAVTNSEKENNPMTISTYFTNAIVRKSLIIASILMFFREACGGNVFSFYAVQVFDKTGSALDSHVSGVVVGIAQLVALLLTTFYVDRVGRRRLLIIAFLIMSLSLTYLGLLHQFRKEIEDEVDQKVFGWFPLISFVIYHAAFSGGPFVLAFTVSSEVVPTSIIGSVSGLTMTLSLMTSFILTRFYEDMNISFGISNTFWIYSALCCLGAICVYALVPETTGKTLESIHRSQ